MRRSQALGMRIALLLALLALTAAAIVVSQVVLWGAPSVWSVVLAAVLTGTAAAWPVAGRAAVGLPACGECGYPSWASVEMHFCIRCGSKRVWQPA